MVDLVKIRKKKQKEKEAANDAAVSGAPPSPAADAPAPSRAEAAAKNSATAPHEAAATPHDVAAAATPQSQSKLERFKAEAGKRRDTEIAQVEEQTAQQLELLTFFIAGEQYAVDIERIIEIVTPRPLTRIPNADASVVGIISLRGTIVTLVDVRRKLRHPAAAASTPDTRIVVIDFGTETVGFVVDRVLRVVKTAAGQIEPHPVVHAGELDDSIRGVFRVGGALTILLDLDKLLDHRALAARTA